MHSSNQLLLLHLEDKTAIVVTKKLKRIQEALLREGGRGLELCSELFSNADMGRNWSLRRGVVPSTKLKCQLQLLYAKMAPYGIDYRFWRLKVVKQARYAMLNTQEMSEKCEAKTFDMDSPYSIPSLSQE